MNIPTVLFYVLAAIAFACGAFGAKVKFIADWTALGFLFLTLSLIF